MNDTLTKEQQNAIADFLRDRHIPSGLGNQEESCSIASINLSLTGELTGKIPDCMSDVIGRWIITVQDSMPDEMRNSTRWRELLPLAAGTGREHEQERLDLILEWMWEAVLVSVQPIADEHGFGTEWQRMCSERTAASMKEAASAALAAAWSAADAAWSAADAAEAAARPAYSYVWAAWAADACAQAAASSASEASAAAWDTFDPCGLLERLIAVGEQ